VAESRAVSVVFEASLVVVLCEKGRDLVEQDLLKCFCIEWKKR